MRGLCPLNRFATPAPPGLPTSLALQAPSRSPGGALRRAIAALAFPGAGGGAALELGKPARKGLNRLCCGTRLLDRFASNSLRQSSHPCGPALLPLPGCRRLQSSWPTKVGHLLLKPPAPASFASRAAPPRHLETPAGRPDLVQFTAFLHKVPLQNGRPLSFLRIIAKGTHLESLTLCNLSRYCARSASHRGDIQFFPADFSVFEGL